MDDRVFLKPLVFQIQVQHFFPMKLNPNAIPFDFTFSEDGKRSRRYDLELMLRLKPLHVRILPEMQKHQHAKQFIRPFTYPLPYMLALKPKHQKPPTVIPPWFSMIYYNHYYPGTPLPVLPKTEEVRSHCALSCSCSFFVTHFECFLLH